MTRLALTTACLFATLLSSTLSAHEPQRSNRGPKNLGSVLVFSGTGWYRHPEIPAINGWLSRQGEDLGMQVDVSETPSDLLKILDRYDVLVMNNCNELAKLLDEKQRAKVEQWYKAGGGIVALHAALVHQKDWPWFNTLAGCDFNSDSEYLEATVVVDPNAKDHPAVKGFGNSFQYKADWTNHDRSVSNLPGFKVLLRVDETSYEPVREYFQQRDGKAMGVDHPIAWQHENGGGRFFYSELGHDVRSMDTPFGHQHIVQAILWAAAKK